MTEFQFCQDVYLNCDRLLAIFPEDDSSVLFDIARYTQKNQSYPLNSAHEKMLSVAVELELIIVNDGQATFSNNFVTVYFLAREICNNQLIPIFENTAQFWEAFEQLCRDTRNQAIKHIAEMVLIVLSRDFSKDICAQVLSIDRDRFWMVYFAITDSLPYINKTLDSLLDMTLYIAQMTKSDMTHGRIYSAISKMCEIQPELGSELFAKLKEQTDQLLISLIPAVLSGISKSTKFEDVYERAFQLIKDENLEIKCQAIFTLSLFDYDDLKRTYLSETINEYNRLVQGTTDSHILSVVAKSYGNLMSKDRTIPNKLVELSHISDSNVQYELSTILFQHSEYKSEPWYKDILIKLSFVEIQYKGIIDNLSYCLHNFVEDEPEFIFTFFEHWVQNRQYYEESSSNIAEVFKFALEELHTTKRWLIEKYITLWFNHNDSVLHTAAADIVNYYGVRESTFQLCKTELDKMDSNDIHFIISKILGYVHWNTMLCALVFSVLQREPVSDVINGNVLWAFNNYIAYNYPGATRDLLKVKIETGSETEIQMAKKILDEIERYFENLRRLPKLKEFYPVESRANEYLKLKARKQDKNIREKSEEGSVLSKLFTKIVLKGGKTSFSKYQGEFSDRTALQEISYSYELPRGEIFDPVGQKLLRYQWRTLRRKEARDETDYS